MTVESVLSMGSVHFGPPPDRVECIEDGCSRPPYIDGQCKAHHDLAEYREAVAHDRRRGR